jgi:hypothetical protein
VLEAAIVLPVLFFLLFAVIETGALLRSYSTTANGVRAGGRMAAVQGADSLADQMIIERIADETEALGGARIQYLIIWNNGQPDVNQSRLNACIAIAESSSTPNTSSLGVSDGGTGADGACNVYVRPQATGGAFQMARGELANPPDYYFGCTGSSDPGAAHRVDCRWPPQNRDTRVSPRILPPGVTTRLTPGGGGVYIKVEHRSLSGVVGSTIAITDQTVNLLEPDTFGVNS